MVELQTIAIANQIRGVGKTFTTLSLGMALAERGRRVLLVDLDPKAGLSVACGVEETEGASLAEVLGGSQPGNEDIRNILIEILPEHHCFLAPSDLALARTDLGLNFRMGRESVLRKALATISSDFDIALIDCPSSLGMLTINGLNSAKAVLIPIRPEIADIRGVHLFLTELAKIKQEINPSLETLGVFVSFYNPTLETHRAAVNAMKEAGFPLLPVGIEANDKKVTAQKDEASEHVRAANGPQAYAKLAELIEQWLAGWRAWQPSIATQ
jgi:chromosome partitioning protein